VPSFELEESEVTAPMEDDSIFTAEVATVKIVEKKYREDKDDPHSPLVKKVEFKFVLEDPDGEYDGTPIWGETGTRFNSHPDCKLKNWAQEILATEFPVGYKLDTDVLLGQKCRVIIGANEWFKDVPVSADHPDGKEKRIRNFVKDVMRSRSAMGDEEPF
jgi:hypothetical protein